MTADRWALRFGANPTPTGVEFRVWAPRLESIKVLLCGDLPRTLSMLPENDGEFAAFVPDLRSGSDYIFVAGNDRRLPDPVSRWQPHGVHGPSRVVDPDAFPWSDHDWSGIQLEEYVIYEIHTGAFSDEGTFTSVIPRLEYLRGLGVTAIELMPVAEFPGRRNWGYDGVGVYAPQSSYGGPHGLKTLVDACHRQGLAVVLDVVYNHVGPEGNYLAEFGPFFTDVYRTPWGQAINYDGPGSDGVRRFFIDNALYWLTEFHIDALRLDAIHGIFDFSACHILQELAGDFHATASRLRRRAWVIAESDLNDPRVIRSPELGGFGVDAQWNDDFHHSVHTVLARDARGYFADFSGLTSLSKAIRSGFVYDGQHSGYRNRRHGASSDDRPGEQFVVFTENHDQVANSMAGARNSKLYSLEEQRVAAAVLLCSPFLPLLFMGQEYGETTGFYYFTDHSDPALIEAVREGRRQETSAFLANGEFLDPQDAATFERSKLNWGLIDRQPHDAMLLWYRDLLAIRKQTASLRNCRKDLTTVTSAAAGWLIVERGDPSGSRALLVCNFARDTQAVPLPARNGRWSRRLWSGEAPYANAPVPEPRLVATGESSASLELPGLSAALYTLK